MNRDKPVAKGQARTPLGEHPVGTAVGGMAGAVAAGAVAGSVAGPLGAVAGAVLGAAAGGFTGSMFAELIDPEAEERFWRQHHRHGAAEDYERDWGPAYRYGVDAFTRFPDREFNEMEAQLAEEWEAARGASRLGWADARLATLDAWQRVRDMVHRKAE